MATASDLATENATLKEQLAAEQREVEQLRSQGQQLQNEKRDLEHKVLLYEEQLATLRQRVFGPSSEKQSAEDRRQGRLFDEAELAVEEREPTEEESPEHETEVRGHTRKARGRKPIDPNLPREEIIIDLSDEEKQCACGSELSRIGEASAEKVTYIPARVLVTRFIRPEYACKSCEGSGDEDKPAVRIAPMPPQIIPKGIATPSLLAFIITAKFVDAVPLYRQEKQFRRLGIELSRKTMADWVIRVGEQLQPVLGALLDHCRGGPVKQMDETTVQVMREPDRPNRTKSFMWVLRGGPADTPGLYYHYAPSRGSAVAKELFGDADGFLQTDGFEAYDRALVDRPDVVHVGCFAHARRKFHEATIGTKKSGAAHQGIAFIAKLYALEKERSRFETDEEFAEYRREQGEPLLKRFHSWLSDRYDTVAPKSALGKAIKYTLDQWEKLRRYLDHPDLTPDTNATERAIRPFVIGRKNWILSGSPRGAAASAALYSLVETAKANGIEPMRYLWWLFEKLPTVAPDCDYSQLLPHNADLTTESR